MIGIQWSTFSTFFFFWYVLMVSFQVGGISSLRMLGSEMKNDLRFLGRLARHGKKVREKYPAKGRIDGSTAMVVSLCVVTASTFLFECIWVPLYDWFQFHSVLWPVYFAETHRIGDSALFTNTLMALAPLLLAPLVLKIQLVGSEADPYPASRYHLKARFGRWGLALALVAAGLWLLWIFFPHDPQPAVTAILQSAHESAYNPKGCWVFPSQGYFPQNTYTFYPCSSVGKWYSLDAFYGFFVPGNALHAVNVLTKFATFAAVCFPFTGAVRRLG